MANVQSVAISFKKEILLSLHALGTGTTRASGAADTFKAALFVTSASLNASTTVYSTTGELTGTGYSAGGVTTAWVAPATASNVAYTTPSASFSWTGLTSDTDFDAVHIYNSTIGNRSVGTYTFGAQKVTSGNFTLSMPTNDQSTGLLRIS